MQSEMHDAENIGCQVVDACATCAGKNASSFSARGVASGAQGDSPHSRDWKSAKYFKSLPGRNY
jgi:hypothetical protein